PLEFDRSGVTAPDSAGAPLPLQAAYQAASRRDRMIWDFDAEPGCCTELHELRPFALEMPLLDRYPTQLVEEGTEADAEEAGRLPAVPARNLERPLDGPPLDHFHLGLEIEGAVGLTVARRRRPVAVAVAVTEGKVLGIEWSPCAEHGGALYGVPELADVSRPGVVGERGQRRGSDAHGVTQTAGCLADEMGEQRRHVLGPLAQRRQVQVDDVQAVEQIGAELAQLDRVLERLGG